MGSEYPEIYKHIEQVNEKLKKYNLKITILKPKYPLFHYMTDYKRIRGKNVGLPYGFPSFKQRWCVNIKTTPINKFKKQFTTTIDYIAYTKEEIKRAKKLKRRETSTHKYQFPLIEMGMSGKDTLEYCYSLGFDWDGLYNHLSRVSCFICPFQNYKSLQYLIIERPELWGKIKKIEETLKMKGVKYWKFKPDHSCKDIERKLGIQKSGQNFFQTKEGEERNGICAR